jgi:hypothetical protein
MRIRNPVSNKTTFSPTHLAGQYLYTVAPNSYKLNFSICFFFNCEENGDYNSSKEEHLKNLKTSCGCYLDRGLSTYVKIFEFYLVSGPR